MHSGRVRGSSAEGGRTEGEREATPQRKRGFHENSTPPARRRLERRNRRVLPEQLQRAALCKSHAALPCRSQIVVAGKVEEPVDEVEAKFLGKVPPLLARVAGGGVDRNAHLAGRSSQNIGFEGDDVRQAGVAKETAVQFGKSRVAQKDQRELARWQDTGGGPFLAANCARARARAFGSKCGRSAGSTRKPSSRTATSRLTAALGTRTPGCRRAINTDRIESLLTRTPASEPRRRSETDRRRDCAAY